ncbi:MAG TPA: helix-turn-helix domain-containing protein [Phycisphaerales bacterium]|nr:helix-turn-helix domain-containing protein [Phycisphaerales bacterium]
MSLGHIIRQRREALRLTLDEVAAATGFSKPYLSTIETGKVKNPPSDRLLSGLEDVLKFDQGALRHLAHLERMPADIRREYDTIDAENRRYKEIIKNIIQHTLEPSRLGEVLAQYALDVDEKSEPRRAGHWVPVINKVAAGYPAAFDDLGYPVGFADDYVRCPDIHDPNAFAVRVVGDSMEPKFREGDIVVFSPSADVQNGDDCFVRFSMPHETTFKRVFLESDGSVRLQPRNTDYPPQVVDGRRINGIYRAVIHFQTL